MTPGRVVRIVVALLLFIAIPSFAAAATTEFRVLFDVDDDDATGCVVNGMAGVDQVLVTQVTDNGGVARVTRTHREVCTGAVLGGAVDIVTTGWDAGWNATNKLLTFETRVPFSAFGGDTLPTNLHVGFDATRNGSVHTALANQNASPVLIPEPPVRRRAIGSGDERHITLDGNLTDWGHVKPAVIGLASNGTSTLRLLRILAWPDTGDHYLYFAATAYLGSDYPYADDNMYLRQPGQSLMVGAPGVLNNDAAPNGTPLTAEKVSDPARGTVVLNADGSFTYSPNHPQLLTDDEFEYRAVGGGKESNVARVVIQVNQDENPNTPQDDHYTTEEDKKKIEPGPGVLANDPHNDLLVASLFSAPSHGTVVLNADGGFTYTPAPNFSGTDTFVYTASKKVGAPEGIGGNATVTITVTPVNDSPSVDPATFTIPENSPNNTVVGTVNADDVEGNSLSYSIIGGNTGGAFSINATSGQIRVANQAALDYETNPTFYLIVEVSDGSDEDQATITINLTDTNEPPVINLNGAPALSYTENEPPKVINGTLTVTDTDSAQLTGATVVISNNFAAGQDLLSFTPVGAITGSFVGDTLTLTGNDTPANYQLALRSVRYQNTSEDPSTAPRTITWTATDGTFTSTPVTSTINVFKVNDAPTITSSNTASIPENTTAVLTVTATDLEGETLTYSISGGADAALFTINATTGALSFISAPNFEAPADAGANNVYDVTVQVSDGTNNPTQNIAVTVTNVNEAPVFTSGATPSVPENTTAVTTVVANDPEAAAITYSITGGADAALFTINAATGALSFVSAPNFEAPADAGANNIYNITVTASDGTNAPTQNLTITVTNVNEAPVITSGATPSVPENTVAVTTVTATDQEGQTLTYSITGGADAALFSINATTGALTFLSAPNYEAPADAGANNVYDVTVQVSDGTNNPTQNLSITVTNVDEAPVFTSGATASVAENTTAVTTVTATDQEGQTITYSISGGADAALFSINSTTGALTFLAAPNFEAPADAGADNQYNLTVTASDGTNAPTQNITVTVTDVNETPVFTSTATPSVPENTTAVVTVTTTDPENNTITYSITGGADAALFSINASTGALSFLSAPNFESPADAGANNVYDVVVTANDGTNAPTQNISVTVTDVNETAIFTSGATPSVPENTTAVTTVTATDPEGNAVTYSITGGADAALFTINSTTGALAFLVAPNFEAPGDAGGNNVYDVTVTANDGATNASQNISVTVTNVNEAPAFTSSATPSVPENTTAVVTVTAVDPEGQTVTYSITGGADMALFTINSTTGALSFLSAPDYDAPADAGANNVYDVVVTATDGTNSPTQAIAVTVTDTNEAPVFTSTNAPSVAENNTAVLTVTTTDQEGDTITYSITGGADQALFSINSSTGALSFNAPPDYENPADADANNVYNIIVTASDGTNAPTQTINVTVTNVNEGSSITSANTASFDENATGTVLTVTATDPEGDAVTYSITGGADMALLSINATTGAVTFNSSPNYEAPADADANNTYIIQVTANSSGGSDVQTITITVNDVNETPAFTSSASTSIPENTTAVLTVTTTDPEGDTITYSISGGADAALFSINASTGALAFLSAPNYEAPADAGANNVYDVVVTASDGTNSPTQAISVTVTNVNEAPAFTSSATPSVAENTTAVTTVTATDPEGAAVTYSITGGADMALFSINSTTGALSFNSAPNYEAPADAGANNVYDVVVTATDGTNSPTQNISITVTDVNEAPSFTSSASPSVPENTTAVVTVTTSDPEGNTITYSITGGADAAFFTINSTTGALSFTSAPNFEAPADAGANNVYDVIVTATDGTNSPTQAIAVTVTNANEAPVFSSSATPSVLENTTAVVTVTATDPEGVATTYAITGGADMALFTINPTTGALSFLVAPNFEAPADAGANNVYDVIVSASDGTNLPTQNIAVTVVNVNEGPTFTSSATPSVPENTTAVTTVTTSDPEGDAITYSITGGADAAFFAINSTTGALSFLSAPNFEAPADAGANNVYDVIVTATDGTNSPTQAISVTVTNVNETPAFTSSNNATVPENTLSVLTVTTADPEGNTITYSITGGADQGDFTINSSTGALSFLAPPNFEVPADADANNVYDVIVTASDGTNSPTQNITVTVTNVQEGPVFTSPNVANFAENGVGTVLTATAVDEDGDTVTYAFTGGTDTDDLSINSTTGNITFNVSPNFEAPTDSDTNNTYVVQVTATSTGGNAVQNITITVTNVNEQPTITSATSFNVNENSGNPVHTVTATDPDVPTTLTYSIVGGADSGDFSINSSTGALSFVATPNFEAPTDADLDNVYSVTVRASDGSLFDDKTLTITVINLNEAPTAVADTYNAVGGTLVHIAGSVTLPATPPVATTGDVAPAPRTTGVKANDTDPDLVPAFNTLTVTFVTGNAGAVAVPAGSQATTTTTHGTVTMHSDGSFHYTPTAGYLGADSFTYTINDAANNATGTVNFTVHAPAIRYVKNNAPTAGNGTSATPHQTLAAAIAASTAGELIYVMEGDGTATNYGGSNILKLNQKLWGQGVALSVTANTVPLNLIAATNRPIIGPGGAQETLRIGNAITGVDIQGLRIDGGTTNALDVTTSGANGAGFTFSNNIITTAGQEGIDINHGGSGSVTASVQTSTITSTGNGFDFARTGTGTANTIIFSNNTLTSGATGVSVAGGAATATTITGFANNTILGTNVGTGVSVSNATFDAVLGGNFDQVNAGTWLLGTNADGVGTSGMLLGTGGNPVAGDLSFTDLDIFASNGTALQVVGSGALAASSGLRVAVSSGVSVLEATSGPAVDVTNATADLQLSSMKSTATTTRGVSLVNVADGTGSARFSAPAGSLITSTAGATGPLFNVSGGNVGVSYAGTIANTGTGRAILVDSLSMDDATDDLSFTGAITENGAGILLNSNSGAGRTITFSGGLTINTTAGEGFAATSNSNSLGLNITGTNTIASTSATALRITNTTIGSNHVTFRTVSSGNATAAADPVNGIVIDTTGSLGNLRVQGTGSANTGGTIQSTTGHAISLNSTTNPQFAWMNIQNAGRSGVDGFGVSGFTFANSTINNVGTAAAGQYEESNISLNDNGTFTGSSVSGAVSITNNTLTNARRHGIDIENGTGTISNLTIQNNVLTSATSAASSLGTGILILSQGSASTQAHITTGTISGNTVTNFPSGEGIAVLGGSGNSSNNTSSTLGANGTPISITNNSISGGTGRMGSNGIRATFNGQNGVANFTISNNGTAAAPIKNIEGQGISVFIGGSVSGTTTINNNYIEPHQTLAAGTHGLAVQVDDGPAGAGTSSADYNFTITNNNVSSFEGNGIRAIARASNGKMDVTIQNNTVTAPSLTNRNGIRVDAGSATGDVTVCMVMTGNTSAGSGVNAGIGIRKQGTVAGTNEFGISGLAPSPASAATAAAKVAGDNPSGGGVDVLSGDNFVNCTPTP